MNWNELHSLYPMDRSKMSAEQEAEFLKHCYELYEKEGFAKVFWTQDTSHRACLGQPFTVIGRLTQDEADTECLPMWKIRFQDGFEMDAFPEEIIPSEMKAQGCRIELF